MLPLAFAALTYAAPPSALATGVALEPVGTFASPLHVAAPPGDSTRQFVVERRGRIYIVKDGGVLTPPFLRLDTAGVNVNAFSVAFAPDYQTSGLFYVHFYDNADGKVRLLEFKRSATDPDIADPTTRRDVIVMPNSSAGHPGGHVLFGPDGYLYMSVGDGDSGNDDAANRAPDPASLFGKILRVDPRQSGASAYTVPPTNPFVGDAAARPEVFAVGLRNPWRIAFGPQGDLFVADPGDETREEIDWVSAADAAGTNFGWSCFEGTFARPTPKNCGPNPRAPLLDYGRTDVRCAVIGGPVANDPALPNLSGRYLYGDYCEGELRSFRVCDGVATDDKALGLNVPELTSFGTDGVGRIYATSAEQPQGPVYRLIANTATGPAETCPSRDQPPSSSPGGAQETSNIPDGATTDPPPGPPVRTSSVAVPASGRLSSRASRSGVVKLARLTVSCGEAPEACTVAVTLTAPAGARRSAVAERRLTLAKRRFRLARGRSSGVTLKLSRRGRARLQTARRLNALAVVTIRQGDNRVSGRADVVLRRAR